MAKKKTKKKSVKSTKKKSTRKYIIFDNIVPVVFGMGMEHDQIKAGKRKPTSAGYCELIEGKFHPYGRSNSLDLDMGEYDEHILNI